MKSRLKRLVFSLQMIISIYPAVFMIVYKLLGKKQHLLVNKDTQIVIEGFPRSGNTFSVVALECSQDKAVNIAHHLHAASQIIWAVNNGIPSVVLIRSPAEAVASFLIREPDLTIKLALLDYIRFYKAVLPYKQKLAIVKFDQVITNYADSIKMINDKFDTSFNLFDHSDENVEKVFDLLQTYSIKDSAKNVLEENKVARPSSDRKALANILNEKIHSGEYSKLLSQANEVYSALISK